MSEQYAVGSEDFALSRVPDHARMGWFDISLNYTGFVIIPTGLMVGVMAAMHFSFWHGFWVLAGGTAIVVVNAILMGYIGYRERTSYALTTRFAFGDQGSRLPSALLIVTSQGWWVIQLLLIMSFFPDIAFWKAASLLIAFGILTTVTTRTGLQKGMTWLNRIAIPALLVLFAISIYRAVAVAGGWDAVVAAPPTAPGEMGTIAAMVMVAALWINGSTVFPDVARYAKSTGGVIVGAVGSFTIGLFGLGMMGLIFYKSLGVEDFGPAFAKIGLTAFAFIVVFAQIWTTNQNQMYSSSLAMANAFRMKRTTCETILLAISLIITVALSAYPFQSVFTGFLIFLGLFLTPVPGVVFAEYYVRQRMNVPTRLEDLPAVNMLALVTYLVTVALNILLWATVPEGAPIGLVTLNPLTAFVIHLAANAIAGKRLPAMAVSR
ncbi:purine-cytosine permease family protein [Microvirga massiliensis]|uniref:purine-cytosine permease family protein n=1 Tax=Microvirga massiliensis TaxID=1033741 RepID=UPI00062BAA53|nr:cytosine permease [Microvirga massiliensis]